MPFIATTIAGNLKENKFVLHETKTEAGRHGQAIYGFGKFKIQDYSAWRRSQAGKHAARKIEILTRLKKYQ